MKTDNAKIEKYGDDEWEVCGNCNTSLVYKKVDNITVLVCPNCNAKYSTTPPHRKVG